MAIDHHFCCPLLLNTVVDHHCHWPQWLLTSDRCHWRLWPLPLTIIVDHRCWRLPMPVAKKNHLENTQSLNSCTKWVIWLYINNVIIRTRRYIQFTIMRIAHPPKIWHIGLKHLWTVYIPHFGTYSTFWDIFHIFYRQITKANTQWIPHGRYNHVNYTQINDTKLYSCY